MFMKLYASEAVHCAISGGVDAKSFCKNGHICYFRTCNLAPQVVRTSMSTTR